MDRFKTGRHAAGVSDIKDINIANNYIDFLQQENAYLRRTINSLDRLIHNFSPFVPVHKLNCSVESTKRLIDNLNQQFFALIKQNDYLIKMGKEELPKDNEV